MVLKGIDPVLRSYSTMFNLATSLDAGEQIDNIYLDMEKAFDRVPHEKLLYKLDRWLQRR